MLRKMVREYGYTKNNRSIYWKWRQNESKSVFKQLSDNTKKICKASKFIKIGPWENALSYTSYLEHC